MERELTDVALGENPQEPPLSIHNSLRTIQQKLNAPKDLENKFGGYKYRSCESILKAAKPLLDLTNTTLVFKDTIQIVGDRFYIVSQAILSNGVQSVSAEGIAREDLAKKGMDGAQLSGATSSYARKYALNALFAIDDNKDPDSINRHGTTDKEITAQAIAEIKSCETTSQLMYVFKQYNSIAPNLCAKDAPIQVALSKRKAQLTKDDFDE